MENLIEAVVSLQERLQRAGIPSVVVGGLALSVWGEPRATRDVDVRVLLGRDEAHRLLSALADEYALLADEPLETLRKMGFLFVQDRTGVRLDLLLADTDFDRKVVERARPVEIAPGKVILVCSAEDLLIYKWISTHPRDDENAASIVHRQGDALDDAYIQHWLEQLERALDDSTGLSPALLWVLAPSSRATAHSCPTGGLHGPLAASAIRTHQYKLD
ncbi:MAG: nucleotidyltransferase [Anaerolineae bacterium]